MPNLFEHCRNGVSSTKSKIRINEGKNKLACALPRRSIFGGAIRRLLPQERGLLPNWQGRSLRSAQRRRFSARALRPPREKERSRRRAPGTIVRKAQSFVIVQRAGGDDPRGGCVRPSLGTFSGESTKKADSAARLFRTFYGKSKSRTGGANVPYFCEKHEKAALLVAGVFRTFCCQKVPKSLRTAKQSGHRPPSSLSGHARSGPFAHARSGRSPTRTLFFPRRAKCAG